MNLIALIEDHMKPVPGNITAHEFGSETVRSPEGKLIRGTSMYLTGEAEAFRSWLKPFDGVWVSNNPMAGEWHVVHVKES